MKLKTLIITVLALLILTPAAFAQTTFHKPLGDKLTFELDPGASISHGIQVINTQDLPVDVELYATDAAVTGSGHFSILSKTAEKKFLGTWVQFKEKKIHLDGKEMKDVEFTITVPPDTTPGSFAGGLSIEPALPSVKLKQTGAIISTRVAMPLFVKVKGKKNTSYKWTDFSYNKRGDLPEFYFSFSNTGNTIIGAKGDITIKNFYGDPVTIPISGISLLQNDSPDIKIPWLGTPFFGFFTATAKLDFSELNMQSNTYVKLESQSKSVTFSVIPWGTIIVILLLIAAIIAAAVIRKISHGKFLKKCVSCQVAAGETLVTIAKKNKVDWRKLAKINRLKPPFDLSPGQKILLPPKK